MALIIALAVVQTDKNDAHTVFVEVVNSTGWSSDGFAFLFGFLRYPHTTQSSFQFHFALQTQTLPNALLRHNSNRSVSWVMTDYDATAHITEEMKNPAIKAPVSILAALGTTYVLGFVLNIALSITMGTAWPDLLASPTGLPVAQIMYNVLGKSIT